MISLNKIRNFFRKFISIKYIFFYTIFIAILACLLYFLTPIKQFLDSDKLSFHIGSLKFSIYSLITVTISLIVLIGTVLWVLKFGEQKLRSLKNIKASNREILIKGFYVLMCAAAFFTSLSILGIDLTALAVVSGTLFLGIGLSIQKVAADYISGFVILFEKSFEVGDLIELNDKTIGFVRQINARFVLVETFCGKEMMVPNEEFMKQRIVNLTHNHSKLRLEVQIQVQYTEDINRVHDLILDVANKNPIVLKHPEAFCLLQDVKDGMIFFSLRFWVADVREGFLIPESKLRFAIWNKLQKEGIKLPMPYRVMLQEKNISQSVRVK